MLPTVGGAGGVHTSVAPATGSHGVIGAGCVSRASIERDVRVVCYAGMEQDRDLWGGFARGMPHSILNRAGRSYPHTLHLAWAWLRGQGRWHRRGSGAMAWCRVVHERGRTAGDELQRDRGR